MNGSKYVILLVVLTGIMLWNIPNTASLLTDSHAFYNGSAPCAKCHGDVLAQLEDAGSVNAIHRNLDAEGGCRACHADSNNTSGRNATQDHHSAYLPTCIECHQNASAIYGAKESHSLIVSQASESTLNPGIDEACILCHTTMTQTVTVRNRLVFPFENDSIAANGTQEYDGTYTTTISNSNITGLHNFNSGVSCIMCHAPVEILLNQSGDPFTAHRQFGCAGCHRGSGMQPGQTNESQITYHAAKIKYCSDCHNLDVHQPPVSRDCNLCHESHGGLKANWSG